MAPANGSRRLIAIALASTAILAALIIVIVIVATRANSKPKSAVAAKASNNVGGEKNVAAPAAPPPALPEWIELRVQRVQVPPGKEWDGPKEERGQKDQCNDVAELAKFGGPKLAIGASIYCELFTSNAQRQADPRQPDLQLLLEAPGVQYKTYIAFDQQSQLFDYPFMIPSAALSDDGVVVTVVDNDEGAERGEEIGSVRLRKQWLIDALTSGRLQTPPSVSEHVV